MIVCRKPVAVASKPLFEVAKTTGVVTMGRGRFVSTASYLCVDKDDVSPLFLPLLKTIDAANGAPRFINADGRVYDPVPNPLQMRVTKFSTSKYGSSMHYNGAFKGDRVAKVSFP